MSGSSSKLSAQLKAIAQKWPQDPFRPNMQLQNFFLSLSAHPNLTPGAVRAAQALRANELLKKYPLSEKTLKPASRPQHYKRIVEGFQKGAEGIGLPWWKRFFELW